MNQIDLKKKLYHSVKKHEEQLKKDGHEDIVYKAAGHTHSHKKGKHPVV